ncbi:hypothetical protein KQX54_016059 [Cotesia glomerata]|uniref:Uncharacterized protein n=1 Tax=Cotesia glomerata TaxID=32391 RepID=A0AAV7INM4_COTGL|nr:hypothetical protein KQX54_016059 [Cotesia glomerata]
MEFKQQKRLSRMRIRIRIGIEVESKEEEKEGGADESLTWLRGVARHSLVVTLVRKPPRSIWSHSGLAPQLAPSRDWELNQPPSLSPAALPSILAVAQFLPYFSLSFPV